MRVSVGIEQRFDRTPDGAVWTPAQFPYKFWTRYLEVFDEVVVLGRVRQVEKVPENALPVEGPGVKVADLPHYIGPWEYLTRRASVKRAVHQAMGREGAYILRVSSQIGALMYGWLRKHGRPYGVEVVCDPHDIFGSDAVQHPLRLFFRWMFTRELRKQCEHASASSYVTECNLPVRYPCEGYTTFISSVELGDDAYAASAKTFSADHNEFHLILVGSLMQRYKALDVLLEALKLATQSGLQVYLKVVGDGKHRAELESLSQRLELQDRVSFLGELPGAAAVRKEVSQADLFVLPSRAEGLPRAMIEAMALGLPCIGTEVGGIPELLGKDDMVAPNDAELLAEKLKEVLSDADRLNSMAARNLERAHDYHQEKLGKRRLDFYRTVSEVSAS